MPGSQLG
jgi:hypothetical protein